MKRISVLLLVLCLTLSFCFSASALNYKQCEGNPATFETFEEACVSGPAYLNEMFGKNAVVNPSLEGYPEGTTWIYRSADRFSSASAGLRKNTTILVYTDEKFDSKEAAEAYIVALGLEDIINECKGSVVLVTPIGDTFTAADQFPYYQLQTAMCNIDGSVAIDGQNYTCAEGPYYGGTTFRYLIGIGGGATFINNYVAPSYDYITRVAGMLLIDGHMERIRDVAGVVPTYLVNCTDRVLEKYIEANDTDCKGYKGDVDYYFNQQLPLQIVYNAKVENPDLAACVKTAYEEMFIKAERVPVVLAGLHSASAPYTANWNQAPYSLCERTAFYGMKTADGLVITEFCEDRFIDDMTTEENAGFFTPVGEYIQTWYEVVPEELTDKAEHSVPLLFVLHGMGDDPVQCMDELGLLTLASKERIAMIAPLHTSLLDRGQEVLPQVVEYMLAKYPQLDPSRVYVTGYSMGGNATLHAINGHAGMFAAAVPHAPALFSTPREVVELNDVNMPIMFTTATYDFCGFGSVSRSGPTEGYEPEHIAPVLQGRFNDYMKLNGLQPIENFDFETYEISGFRADTYVEKTLNNEYRNYTWMFNNADGVPMVGLNVTDYLIHGLYPEFGQITWDFVKHYSRDLETGAVIYNPYVD